MTVQRVWWPALAALVISFVGVGEAGARNPEDVFRGQIVTSAKPMPTSAKSKAAYISRIKQLKTTKFWEDKANQRWKIHYAAFFQRPLNDVEITVKIFDISSGRQRLMTSFEQYLDSRGQKSVISHLTLERRYVGVNKQIMMVMENRGKIFATGRFYVLGQGEKFSGEVSFTEEEAKKGEEE